LLLSSALDLIARIVWETWALIQTTWNDSKNTFRDICTDSVERKQFYLGSIFSFECSWLF
jgi:hypothetical protein